MKKQINYFFIVFVPFTFFSVLAVYYFSYNIKMLALYFLLFYLFVLIKSIYFFGFLSIYSIYLYTSFFFVYSRLFFDLIGFRSFLAIRMPVDFTFSDETGVVFILISFFAFYICDIVFSLNTKKELIIKCNFRHSGNLQNIGILIIIMMMPLLLYKLNMQLQFVRERGYLSIYNGELAGLSYPIWTRGSGTLLIIGYMLFLMSYPRKKIFILVSLLYLFNSFFTSLQGARSVFLIETIVVLYLYSRFYNVKINIGGLIVLFLGIILFSIMIAYSRVNRSVDSILAINNLFYSQGNTIGVPLAIIENKDNIEYRRFPFIFSSIAEPYFSFIYGGDASLKTTLENFNHIGRITAHKLHAQSYFLGHGMGGSFLAEMYDFGGVFGIILWSVIFAFIISVIEKYFLFRQSLIPFFYFLIGTYIYLPRGSFFGFINNMHYIFLLFVIFYIFEFLIFPKKLLINRIR